MKKTLITIVAIATPFMAFAQQTAVRTVNSLLDYILYLADRILPMLILAALIFLLWGIFQLFFYKKDTDSAKKREFVIYGIIGLFVMTSVWGFVNFLGSSLQLDPTPPSAPHVPQTGGSPNVKDYRTN